MEYISICSSQEEGKREVMETKKGVVEMQRNVPTRFGIGRLDGVILCVPCLK